MQIYEVLVIILIYAQTILPSLISTNSLRREISNVIKKTDINNNHGGILTQKGRKIELTPDGNFIICGIDSLEDDYYGCQSSYEVHIYKTYRTGKNEELKQVSMAATKGSSVKKKQNMAPKFSLTVALIPITKPTIMTAYYASTPQADLFNPRTSDKLFKYLNTVRSSRSLFKNTSSSSTTPIFATSSETRRLLWPSSKTAPTSNVGTIIKQQSRIISISKTMTPTLKSKPTVIMAYYASTRQPNLFSPRASDKLFEYLNTVRPSRSLFKNTKSSSTTPIFATSSETRHPFRPSSKTAPTSNVGNLINQQSRIIVSIPRTTTLTSQSKPTVMMAYYASTPQSDLFSPRASDKLFEYINTVRPSRSLFKNTQSSSTTPIFATSSETRHFRPSSKTAPTSNIGNLIKQQSRIIKSIPKTTAPTPKSKQTVMMAYYASTRQADCFSTRAAEKLFDYLGTVNLSRPLFKRTMSSTTPIFATSVETRNPVRTNSKTAPTNNVSNHVMLKNSIIPILRPLKTESNMPIEPPGRVPSHVPNNQSQDITIIKD